MESNVRKIDHLTFWMLLKLELKQQNFLEQIFFEHKEKDNKT